MPFPYHDFGGWMVAAPHHLYYGVIATLVICWRVADTAMYREAWGAVAGMSLAVVGFVGVWPVVPPVGAALTVISLVGGLGVEVTRSYWRQYDCSTQIALVGSWYIAFDDAAQHAFGWPMPLDQIWKLWLYPAINGVYPF